MTSSIASDDAKRLWAKLDATSIPYPWPLTQWLEIGPNYGVITMADQAGQLLGLCLFYYLKGDDYLHLLKIGVHREFRRQGVAHQLMQQLLEHACRLKIDRIGLEVSIDNQPAISLYRQFGALTVQHKKAFYSDGCDALFMLVSLPGRE